MGIISVIVKQVFVNLESKSALARDVYGKLQLSVVP